MASAHLIFDLGASSGRAMIGRLEAGKLSLREAHRFKNYPVERGGSWYWEFDHLVAELKEGFRKAFALDPGITTFSIDTWGVDYVFFRGGKPIRDPFNYRDERTYAAMEALHRKVSRDELFAATGIQLMNINTVYQLFAHREAFPGDFEDGSMMLFMPDALHYVLTGDTRTEYTIASTGALLDPRTRDWNRRLLAKLGLPESVFTPIVPPSTAGMPLRAEIAAELGIPRVAGIKCGSHDTASAVAALPLRDGGAAAYVSLGTWALLGAELPAPMLTPEAGRAHYTNEGGLEDTIRFLTNITGTWILQECRRVWSEEDHREISFGELSQLAANSAAPGRIDPNDDSFSPPGDMPKRIVEYCRRTGQRIPEGRGEILRTVYDSLAEAFAAKLAELEKFTGQRYGELHIIGGGVQDRFLMQLTADAIGRPVAAGPVEATATGNLLSQLAAAGEIPSLAEGRRLVADSFPVTMWQPQR